MPHFDEDDRDEVFEKDSKESKEFKENGEEMEVDVDDEQVNIWGFLLLKNLLKNLLFRIVKIKLGQNLIEQKLN